jgi:hypothetical protein
MPRVRAVLTPDEHLRVFVLEGLFPLPHAFVTSSTLGTLLHLSMQPDMPHPVLLAEQQFTEQELSLVVPLLTNYPEFAPLEELYASFCYGYDGLSEQRIDQAREHVHEALEEGIWDQELRPLRNVLSRARIKLRHLGLDAVNLLETGYLLMTNTRRKAHE